jgi:hypothetical protein
VMNVLERMAARGPVTGVARAGIADSNDQHLGPYRLETVQVLEVTFKRVDELLLDVEDAAADLADRVVMIPGGQLVVSRTLAKVRRVNGP